MSHAIASQKQEKKQAGIYKAELLPASWQSQPQNAWN